MRMRNVGEYISIMRFKKKCLRQTWGCSGRSLVRPIVGVLFGIWSKVISYSLVFEAK